MFGEDLHYEINGRKFDNIGSAAEKEHMARALGYIIVKSAKDATDIYNVVNDLPNVRAKIRTGFSMGIKCISFVCYYPDGETFSIDIQDQSCINEYETIKFNIYG